MGKKRLRAIADRGYYSALQIKARADSGIAPILPKPTTSGAKAEGRFDRSDFIYIVKDDEYQCPAGACDLPIHSCPGRPAGATVLEQRLPAVPDESSVHAQPVSTNHPLGT